MEDTTTETPVVEKDPQQEMLDVLTEISATLKDLRTEFGRQGRNVMKGDPVLIRNEKPPEKTPRTEPDDVSSTEEPAK